MKLNKNINLNKLALSVCFLTMFAMKFGNNYVHLAFGIFSLIFSFGGMVFSIIVRSKKLIAFFFILLLISLSVFLSMYLKDFFVALLPVIFIAFIILIYNDAIKDETRKDAIKKLKRDRISLISILIIAQVAMIYGYYIKFIR